MDPKKPCPSCGHEINAPKPSEDGVKPPKIVEDPLAQEICDVCGSKIKDFLLQGRMQGP